MHKIAVIGGNGVIGSSFVARSPKNIKIQCYSRSNGFDIKNSEKIKTDLLQFRPDLILFCANTYSIKAMENLDKEKFEKTCCEYERCLRECLFIGSKLVYLSSDHVFGGRTGGYTETSARDASSLFGKYKKKMEDVITREDKSHIIIRTSAVFGSPNARANSFEAWAIRQLVNGNDIAGFDNIYFTPTYIFDLIRGLFLLIDLEYEGVIHISGNETYSRYEFLLLLRNCLSKRYQKLGQVFRSSDPDYESQVIDTSLIAKKFWDLAAMSCTPSLQGLSKTVAEII